MSGTARETLRAVLFDMDGVIFDSERALMACWQELGEHWGLGDMTEVYYDCVGITTEATGEVLKRAYGEDFDWQRFRRESTALYLERYGDGGLPLKPGTEELLRSLREQGLSLALASSTQGELVRRFLKNAGLLDCFSVLVTGDMVRRSKPDPEIFLRASEGLGVTPEQALVIEDSFNGVRAAYAGGIRVLMVPDLLAPDGEMRQKAEAILPTLFEVREYLLK